MNTKAGIVRKTKVRIELELDVELFVDADFPRSVMTLDEAMDSIEDAVAATLMDGDVVAIADDEGECQGMVVGLQRVGGVVVVEDEFASEEG